MSVQKYLFVFAAVFALAGCDPEISGSFGEDPDPGSADFSTFIALGDSLTAGYKDSALYREGQVNSYPAILAQQFALVGGGAFIQPLRLPEATGSFIGIPPTTVADRLVVVSSGNPDPPVTAATIDPPVPTALTPMPGTPFNNFGVPGAKSFHAISNDYGDPLGLLAMPATSNPFYVRFATVPAGSVFGGSSMIDDAAARNSTFFVLWIGNNDVLSYATAGGYDPVGMTRATDQNAANNPDPSTYTSSNDITDDAAFAGIYNMLLMELMANPNTRGVLVKIPDVTTIPYFTTVPFNPIPMDAATAAAANAAYNGYNMGLQISGLPADEIAQRTINFVAGQNPVVITDLDLTPGGGLPLIRQATANDYIVLLASSKIGTPSDLMNPLTTIWGVGTPLEDGDVLTETEVASVEAARTAYNDTIEGFATGSNNLVLFDASATLTELNTTGILYGSGGISSAYIQGGGFSLDGVHPTARGYAVIANEIFKVINEGFGAYIPPVNPNDYTTVFYQ